jgi:hypothetical protein
MAEDENSFGAFAFFFFFFFPPLALPLIAAICCNKVDITGNDSKCYELSGHKEVAKQIRSVVDPRRTLLRNSGP